MIDCFLNTSYKTLNRVCDMMTSIALYETLSLHVSFASKSSIQVNQ